MTQDLTQLCLLLCLSALVGVTMISNGTIEFVFLTYFFTDYFAAFNHSAWKARLFLDYVHEFQWLPISLRVTFFMVSLHFSLTSSQIHCPFSSGHSSHTDVLFVPRQWQVLFSLEHSYVLFPVLALCIITFFSFLKS